MSLGVKKGTVSLAAFVSLEEEFIPTALRHHVDDHTAGAHADVLGSSLYLDIFELGRDVVIHRETLRGRIIDIDTVQQLRVLRVRCAARIQSPLQSALIAADIRRVENDTGRL